MKAVRLAFVIAFWDAPDMLQALLRSIALTNPGQAR